MLALARMYRYGLGVNKDEQMAENLYERLAERQNPYAQYQLAMTYLKDAAHMDKARALLTQAEANGNMQAGQILQRLNAQSEDKISYLEPLAIYHPVMLKDQPADLSYLEALNDWNRGEVFTSRQLLRRLVLQHPEYELAKRAYEQLGNEG